MKKILVIEDERLVQLNIIKILKYEGFEVYDAENGERGIHLAKEISPDLILCDIMMPVINGYDVAAELQQDPRTRQIPFVFLTAKVERSDVRLGMNLGADDYLTKPFSRDELLETIFSRLDKQESANQHFQGRVDQIRDNITTSLPEKLFVPLERIRSFLGKLQDQEASTLPPAMRDELKSSDHSMQQLERYLQNFFLYSILETTKQNPQQASALRGDCITQSADIIAEIAHQKAMEHGREASLRLNTSACDVPMLEANLVNIIEELVDNAFKFSPSDSVVEVSTRIEQEQMMIKIVNEVQSQCIQPSPSDVASGGLGLAIVKQLIDLHDGKLMIESEMSRKVVVQAVLPIISATSMLTKDAA